MLGGKSQLIKVSTHTLLYADRAIVSAHENLQTLVNYPSSPAFIDVQGRKNARLQFLIACIPINVLKNLKKSASAWVDNYKNGGEERQRMRQK